MSVKGDYIADVPGIPGDAGSFWMASAPLPQYPRLEGDVETDVAVVGGGMVGVLTALFLSESGKKVALLESRRILGDVTGHTTAKVTAQHGEIYAGLGPERARAYAEAQTWAIEELFRRAEAGGIDCDLQREELYLYTEDLGRIPILRREAEAAQEAGLPAMFVEELPLPFPTAGGVRVLDQARFHPLKFLGALLGPMTQAGVTIHENTRVLEVHDGEPCRVVTDAGTVQAREVIVASNFPMHDTAGFFSRLFPQRSYALAMRVEEGRGMAFTSDGSEFAVRYQPAGETIAIVSGASHHAGQGGDERDRYADLVRMARERLGEGEILYHWSTQDNHTADKIPFIGGEPRDEHVLMATGFNGWGMTNSFVAARVLTSIVEGEPIEWAHLFDPGRVGVGGGAATFLRQNVDVAKGAVEGVFGHAEECEPESLQPGEGGICIKDRKKEAAFRDESGTLHEMNPHCTHLRCVVEWNEAEKTWDCPCHGSRYDAEGVVLHGPALHDLKPAAREVQAAAAGRGRDRR